LLYKFQISHEVIQRV